MSNEYQAALAALRARVANENLTMRERLSMSMGFAFGWQAAELAEQMKQRDAMLTPRRDLNIGTPEKHMTRDRIFQPASREASREAIAAMLPSAVVCEGTRCDSLVKKVEVTRPGTKRRNDPAEPYRWRSAILPHCVDGSAKHLGMSHDDLHESLVVVGRVETKWNCWAAKVRVPMRRVRRRLPVEA